MPKQRPMRTLGRWIRIGFAFHLALAASPAPAQEPRPPNILLLLSDDHNYRALGASGNGFLRTPHLDRLAREGVYFDRCFTPNPICAPSRACLFTGQDSWTNGLTFNGMAIRESSPLLPRLLAEAGYETWFGGKWHSDGKPWTRGFTSGGRCWAGGTFDPFAMALTGFGEGPETREIADRYSSTVFTDDAVAYLEGEHARPFFMVLAYTVGHDAFRAPPGYEGRYSPGEVLLSPNFMPRPPFRQFNPEIRDENHLITGEVQLFDLVSDPFELTNLAGATEHAAIEAELRESLAAWRATGADAGK
jgi:arylsulfatase A-like enzyme